jgi:hypothetical protein
VELALISGNEKEKNRGGAIFFSFFSFLQTLFTAVKMQTL